MRTEARGTQEHEGPERANAPDPDLEPGFPVQTYERAGSYRGGQAINALVTDLDRDSTGALEICATALAIGPLYCWDHNGVELGGWGGSQTLRGAAYAAGGELSGESAGAEIFTGFYGADEGAQAADGTFLNGWPQPNENFVTSPPTIAPLAGSVVALIGEEDRRLHAYRGDGSVPSGWPFYDLDGGQERHTPAVANVDGVPGAEVFTASGSTTPGVYLFGTHADGTPMEGYPLLFEGDVDTYPAVADIDGDGVLELVVVGQEDEYPWRAKVLVFTAATGALEGARLLDAPVAFGTAPAIADLDQSCTANPQLEMIVQTEEWLSVLRWDGTAFSDYPGWPVSTGAFEWQGGSSPVVGDLDGDGLPDIAVTNQQAGETHAFVRVYDRDGALLPGFPKNLELGGGGVPAIADVDADGRNELIVKGTAWDGTPGPTDTLWVYDLHGPGPYGPVHWGQFMGSAQHGGTYERPPCIADRPVLTATNPPSPANDLTPQVLGRAPADSTVKLYDSADCSGSPIGIGTAAQLAAGGIEASVPTDTTAAIRAVAVDTTGAESGCSAAINYVEDSSPPVAPTLDRSEPASPSNWRWPRIFGSGEAGSIIRLYTSSDCAGPRPPTGTAAEFDQQGIEVPTFENQATEIRGRAVDPAGNVSACSAPLTFVHDGIEPPRPTLTATDPASPGNDSTPRVKGVAEPGSTVRLYASTGCGDSLLATGTAAELADPGIEISVSDDTTTTIVAWATDAAGNQSSCSFPIEYVEDSNPPDTTILSGPPDGGVVADATPQFGFTADDGGASFECRIDDGPFESCTTPYTTAALADGWHTFAVRARDQAQNVDSTPASRTFYVWSALNPFGDLTAPRTRITSKPPRKQATAKRAVAVSFSFSANEPARFNCRLDGELFRSCASPFSARAKIGDHRFRVRALDLAGNRDPTPATHRFEVRARP